MKQKKTRYNSFDTETVSYKQKNNIPVWDATDIMYT